MSETAAPYVVTLGTAGGPRWWRYQGQPVRAGIATAVVVGGAVYLVDCGYGAGRQLVQAGFGLHDVAAIFLTHLHSDHVVDLTSIALFSTFENTDDGREPIALIGPGDRGVLPPTSPHAAQRPQPVAAHGPTPGTAETLARIVEAHATDLNERILDSLRPSPLEVIRARDIVLPEGLGFEANENPVPEMAPFVVYEDSRVRVSAILVEHPPMAPAFGYRFDTEGGSVVISGDTAFTPNMIALAEGADLLLHEAIDLEWLMSKFADPTESSARATRSHHERSHTSIADALAVARSAGVGRLALHHLVPGTSADSLKRQLADAPGPRAIVPDDLDVLPLRRR
ncbi:MBL fold metallo-hydrolase [Gulosibacter sp. 10]|uniref:MBL fold metallo-hydrolase n=1 Tax=Gulosibacter sp. 10 TaxID=1255570 RepID=UPI00097F5A51|nr:MBL fold metallo-hydrolase [Gulosibacter sp. 10]SJM54700.1 possible hydrolase [Gulosibacter sp. 10]